MSQMTTGRLKTLRYQRCFELNNKRVKNVLGTSLRYRVRTDEIGGLFMSRLSDHRICSTWILSYGIYTVGQCGRRFNMKIKAPTQTDARLAGYTQHFAELKQELEKVSYFCKGTVLKRMMKCGQRRCACHQDPAKRHGPYFEWTYKEKGKTVNRRLRPEEVPFYEVATQQYRKLRAVLVRMEKLSRNAVMRLALMSLTKKSP